MENSSKLRICFINNRTCESGEREKLGPDRYRLEPDDPIYGKLAVVLIDINGTSQFANILFEDSGNENQGRLRSYNLTRRYARNLELRLQKVHSLNDSNFALYLELGTEANG